MEDAFDEGLGVGRPGTASYLSTASYLGTASYFGAASYLGVVGNTGAPRVATGGCSYGITAGAFAGTWGLDAPLPGKGLLEGKEGDANTSSFGNERELSRLSV